MVQADNLLQALLPAPHPDPDLRVQLRMLHIDYLVRTDSVNDAFLRIQSLAEFCENNQMDVYHRIRLLNIKAKVFRAIGKAQQGLSLAIRALAAAWRARLLPVLWEAVSVLAGVLSSLEEYGAAEKLVGSVVYQVSDLSHFSKTLKMVTLLRMNRRRRQKMQC